MKKGLKVISAILASILTVLFAIPLASVQANAEDGIEYYGRQAVSEMKNGDRLLYAYDRIMEGVSHSFERIELTSDGNGITKAELDTVYDAYTRDHVEHFWLGQSYQYTLSGDKVIHLLPSYNLSGEELDIAKARFNEATSSLLSKVDLNASEYEKELKIHDILATMTTYDLSAPNAHNAYGAIVEGRAVCEGYAEALQHMLLKVGINSYIITGSSKNPITNKDEGHAWNVVKINGSYYHVDLTWNDQGNIIYHSYFNVTEDVIKKDHKINKTDYDLPICNSDKANYFNVTGTKITQSNGVQRIANLLRAGKYAATFFVWDSNSFNSWINDNIRNIINLLNISGTVNYTLQSVGNQHTLILLTDACKHSSLTEVKRIEATCTEDGTSSHYVCNCGSVFIGKNTTSDLIIDKNILTIYSLGHTYTKAVKDDTHKVKDPESCLEYDTYKLDCLLCGTSSETEFVRGSVQGAHDLDDNGNCNLCPYPYSDDQFNNTIKFNFDTKILLYVGIGVVVCIAAALIAIIIKKRRSDYDDEEEY